MADLIDRQKAIDALRMDISIIPFAKAREYVRAAIDTIYNRLEELPSAQPEQKELSDWKKEFRAYVNTLDLPRDDYKGIVEYIEEVPTVPQEQSIAQASFSQHHENDYSADDSKMVAQPEPCDDPRADVYYLAEKIGIHRLYALVTALRGEPEMHHCCNCGRTANNGGWYKDGRTRCPIEEHYQLPIDGYCHLWEKRNVTDDDYPERREE